MKQYRAIALALTVSALAASQPVLAKPVASAVQRSQFVTIEGVRNFRDVGGYRTAQGKTVRWGLLYRAGTLGSITPQGRDQFSRLGVGAIVDLRTAAERQRSPEAFLGSPRIRYWSRDYDMGGGKVGGADPARPMSAPRTPQAVSQLMYGAYRTIPKEMAPSYRELFARLGAGNAAPRGAVVLNCTAGKDRTGIGTALVLYALGVPYATIRQDFLLSNVGVNPAALRPSLPPDLAALSDEALMPLAGVDGAYLDTAFAQLRHDYGSVDGYLEKEVGIGPREIAQLRRRMLR